LDYAQKDLTGAGLRCVRLDGTMAASVRQEAIDAFQGGEADVFLQSLKARGVGINLTAADYVIHLDPWWNPPSRTERRTVRTAWGNSAP
jgi:SNF2 family DNA or RNA helicase